MKIAQNDGIITLRNSAGMEIVLCARGAGIRDIFLSDRNNIRCSVTVFPMDGSGYHGKTIGRTAGRIAGATFEIDGKVARLQKNNFGVDNLHGGAEGFHDKIFDVKIEENKEYTLVKFSYFSKDGEGGYFGNVNVVATYKVYENENKFATVYDASADEKTILNLTNHVYWNLSGDRRDSVLNHELFIGADRFAKLDERLIIKEILPVNEHMDFNRPHNIGKFIEEEDVQKNTLGYDHQYFFGKERKCSLYCKESGIKLDVETSYPCVVLYTDNQSDGKTIMNDGTAGKKYSGVCLECQYHPDGVHACPENCGIIDKDKPYREETEFTFTIV